jgi:hypothetical protein
VRLPGACALAFPPIEGGRDPAPHRREDWLHVSLGLSQPIDRKQVEEERRAGKVYSARGFELAFVTQEHSLWAVNALYFFLTSITDGEEISWGDRFPFGLHLRDNGEIDAYLGAADELDLIPYGELRAVLFWPYLFPDWEFVTSTGKFMILVATGITADEWEAAKGTTTAHLLLLLCRAGIGQRTLPARTSLLADRRWRDQWRQIEALGPQQCEEEITSIMKGGPS